MTLQVEWSWRHGPVTGPAHATTGLAAAAIVAGLPALHVAPELVAGSALAGVGVIVLRGRGAPASTVMFRLTAWLAATAWLMVVLSQGVSFAWLLILAVGAATLGAVHWPVAEHRRNLDRPADLITAEELTMMDRRALADRWQAWIADICRINVRVLGIERWVRPGPDGTRDTGYSIEVALPGTGVGWQDLARFSSALANAADLPPGCGVEVGPGVGRRRALIEVSTVDALRDDIPIPLADRPRTVNDPIDLGALRDGSPALAPIRFDCWALVGATDSGKSNELRTLICRLLECDDVIPVVIDPNGGGLVSPFLEPWVAGQVDRPPLVVVDTPEEAARLLTFLGELIGVRKRSQAAPMREANDDKVPVSRRVPQIIVIADEAGSLPAYVQGGFVDVSDRGRGSGIRTVYCSLRGTSVGGYLPKPVKVQAKVRIGMRTNDVDELRYLFGRGVGDPADTPAAGYGHLWVRGDHAVHKGYRTTPQAAADCARRTAAWRPEGIEPESMALLPPDVQRLWTEVWDRNRHIADAVRGTDAGPSRAKPEHPRRARPAAHPGGMHGALDDLRASREQLRDAMQQAQAGGVDAFADIVRSVHIPPTLIMRLLLAFEAAGADRMHTAELEAAVGAAEGDLGRLLPQLGVKALPHGFPRPGRPRSRGYAAADIQAAADAIRDGSRQVPREVADWRPASP